MIATAKKYLVWIWMTALLSATIGISGHRIYCYCVGKTTFSFFQATDACQEEGKRVVDACCQKKPARHVCCDTEDAQDAVKSNCTKKTTEVFKLKTEFVVEQQALKAFCVQALEMPQAPLYAFTLPAPWFGALCLNKAPPAPPPPFPGRFICLRHELFRC